MNKYIRMKKTNISLIGCGAVAEYYHLPVLQRMPEFNIKYLVDLDQNRSTYLKKLYRLESETVDDLDIVLKDDQVDAVLLLTPPKLHKDQIIEVARAGKHIFCEKPLSMNNKEAKEILQVCKQENVNLLVGYQMRFDGKYSKIKELISKKMFGKIVGGHGLHFANAFEWPSITKFQTDRSQGGGALFEMMHFVDLATWFFGKAISLQSQVLTRNKKSSVDDSAYLSINFENDVNVSLHIGWNKLTVNSFTVFGTEGYIRALSDTKKLHFHAKDLLAQPPILIRPNHSISPFHDELLHFHNIVQGKEKPITTSDEILQNSIIIEKSYDQQTEKSLIILEE
ncbi:MAG: Gfo/Idh/MocA family oxidoreductase [Candidatus Heimdallarchaeota archaeon]|nr:Gfo/Idh/MocA family oxidoreductase [Candidatus Heimdallarchaeota archaeon]MCK4878314.1 Gfo/Idh/MocA family oxidoreductase [Candidatus Heimdallarchaeota archaeon]